MRLDGINLRAALLAGTALTALLIVPLSGPAQAQTAGGAGGRGASNESGGAGGSGYSGAAGQDGASNPAARGGGGGGGAAGGGSGGSGGDGNSPGGGGSGGVGSGAAGTDGGAAVSGGGGGAGGANGTLGSPVGASGGNGGVGGINGGGSGGGGAGGYGVIVNTDATLSGTGATAVSGGNGGLGGDKSGGGNGGNGGDGGVGVLVSSGGVTLTNTGTIGSNTTAAVAGRGGNGGVNSFGSGNSGNGGNGGAGVIFTGSGTLANSGSITGGDGGTGLTAGAGGAGVIGANLTVTNSGTVTGGISGDGATRADAITFTGGANAITFTNATSGLTGNIGVTGSLEFRQATAVTVSNVVTGTGSISKTNAGTLALSGANTYSGGTTITAGTLQIGNGGTTGSIAGNVTNNATLAFNRSDAVTFGGAISGTGAVQKLGAGTLTLSNTNTYSGGTTVSAGTLALSGAGTLGNIANATAVSSGILDLGTTTQTQNGGLTLTGGTIQNGTLSSSGTFGLQAGAISAALAGTGGVTKTTVGTVTLSGTNTYTGGTTIAAGILAVSADANLGNSAGGLTLTLSAALRTTATFTSARDVTINTAGQIQTDAGVTTTLSGVIADGSGAAPILSKLGAGTLTLTGANTYSRTAIFAGTLQIGNGGTTGSIIGNVFDSATLAFNRSDASTFGGVISGIGSVQMLGAGTLTLTGTNTYNGGTTMAAGTLAVSADANLGDSTAGLAFTGGTLETTATFTSARGVTLNTAGTIQTDSGVTTTLSGVLANGGSAGSLTKTGAGTLTLSGTNTYTGGTTISAGTLQIGNGGTTGSIAGNVTNNATLALNRSDAVAFAGVISGTGALNQIGAGTTTLTGANSYSGGTTITTGTLQIGNGGTTGSIAGNVTNNATLAFNRSDAVTFGGAISGTGALQKLGGGNLVLSGANTYTGATVVNAGTLSVNGSIASSSLTTVNSGGTLGGTGTVGNTTIGSGGTLAPGNSIGTITVNGNLTFNSGANYNIEVSPSAADRTNVTGTATLGGATVNASFATGSYISKQYTILNTTGGRSGTFGGPVNTNLPANFTAGLSYDANNAFLDLTLNFTPPPAVPGAPNFGSGLSGNQSNVANALVNYFNTSGGIPMVFGTLNANGLSQAAGQPGASTAQPGITATGQFVNAIFDAAFDDNSGPGATNFAPDEKADAYAPKRKLSRDANDAYAAVTPRHRSAPSFTSRWNVWASAYGGNSRVSGNAAAGTSTTTSRIFGTAVGASYTVSPNTQIGFAAGGAGSNFGLDGSFGGGRADVFNLAAYAKQSSGSAYIAGLLGYSWQDTTTDRTVTIAGTDQLRASFKAQALSARLEGGWRYATPMAGVTPYAALQTTTFYLPGYGEAATSGANTFALNYTSKTITATRGELGAKFDKPMLVRNGVFTLKAKTAWAHDWNTDRSATATFQALPGATFVVNGAQPSANAALLSLGAEMKWQNGWSLAGSFDGEFSRTTAGYAGKGSVKYAW